MTKNDPNSIAELDATTRRLLRAVTDMGARVNTTQEMQAALASTMRRVERQQGLNRWLVGVVALILALGAGFAYSVYRIDDNADTLREVQDRTSNTVLCPLYSLFLAQTADLPPDAADSNEDGTVTPEEQAQMEQTVRVIQEGYAALNCQEPTQ